MTTNNTAPKQMYNTDEMAAIWGVTPYTVRLWCRDGRLPDNYVAKQRGGVWSIYPPGSPLLLSSLVASPVVDRDTAQHTAESDVSADLNGEEEVAEIRRQIEVEKARIELAEIRKVRELPEALAQREAECNRREAELDAREAGLTIREQQCRQIEAAKAELQVLQDEWDAGEIARQEELERESRLLDARKREYADLMAGYAEILQPMIDKLDKYNSVATRMSTQHYHAANKSKGKVSDWHAGVAQYCWTAQAKIKEYAANARKLVGI